MAGAFFPVQSSTQKLVAQEKSGPEEQASPEETKPSEPQDLGEAGARYPRLSPDGKLLAFSLHGDLWTIPVEGGRANRLTLHEANDLKPVWSPDGKRIAFTSDRSGSWDIWLMPAEGGVPTRITYDGGFDHMNQFTPDGENIIFQSTRNGSWRIYQIPVSGGTPIPLVLDKDSTLASIAAEDSEMIYYQYAISDSKMKGYRGSANDEIFRTLPRQIPERLTNNNQNDREPFVSPQGDKLYFIRETGESGKDYNLFVMDLESREETQLTHLDSNGISSIAFNADFSKLYGVWKYRLYEIDLLSETKEPKLIPVKIVEDTRRDPVITRTITSGTASLDISPDGSLMTFELGGSIWIMKSSGGEATQLTSPGSGDAMPRFSPDGSMIAFFSATRSGNEDLFVIDIQSRRMRQLTHNQKADQFHNWAPDGSYLVFASDRGAHRDIWKIALDGSPPVQLTNNPYSDDDPSVSPDGSLIAFDSWGHGNADIYVMNPDGSGVRRVYGTLAQEESPRFSPDSQLLVFTRTNVSGISFSRNVVVTDLQGSGEIILAEGSGGCFTPDGKEILYVSPDGKIKAIPAPTSIQGGRTIPFIATEKTEQSKLFIQSFDEAWELVHNNFYDPEFHGVDWKAMRNKYRPLVESCKTRREFYYYVTEMIGELNASHQGIYGPISDIPGYNTGFLGCELIPEVIEAKDLEKSKGALQLRLRVKDPEKGGAVDKAWIRHDDYIFGVDGKRLGVEDNFYQLLKNRIYQPVRLMVGSSPDADDIREVVVMPEHHGQTAARRYGEWIKTNKEKTTEKSDKQVAYIHIPRMRQDALVNFQNELGSAEVQAAKALVLDVRNNGGGNIHQELIDILSRRHYANNTSQKGEPTKSPELFWDRPIVLLINEDSYSDAEVFPHAIKTLGLATIVGVATPGAVIGTRDLTLSDGSTFRVTLSGFVNLDGTNQEGNGCEPDVKVEVSAEDRILKRDPQLNKAIEIALEKIALSTLTPGEGSPDSPAEEEPVAAPEESSNNTHKSNENKDTEKGKEMSEEQSLEQLRERIEEVKKSPEKDVTKIKVVHILIGLKDAGLPGVSRSLDEAEKRAANTYQRILAGEDFHELVKELSDDSGEGIYTMISEGMPDHGKLIFLRKEMVSAFGDVGWKLEPEEIGISAYDPATSPFGFHIIKRLE